MIGSGCFCFPPPLHSAVSKLTARGRRPRIGMRDADEGCARRMRVAGAISPHMCLWSPVWPNMPKRFRSKKRNSVAPHKYRVNKTKNYSYHNPDDVKAKIGDEDVTGQGNFYCESCCRHFASSAVLEEHGRSKDHKKEVKKRKWDDEMDKKEAALVTDYKRKRIAASHSAPATEQHSDSTFQSD